MRSFRPFSAALGAALLLSSQWGCEGPKDPEYTMSPGGGGQVADPYRPAPQRPQASGPQLKLDAVELRFDAEQREATLRLRNVGGQVLLLTQAEVVPPSDWRVQVQGIDLSRPEALGDPDGDGEMGLAPGAAVNLQVTYVGPLGEDSEGTLSLQSNSAQRPRQQVTFLYEVARAGEADAGAPPVDAEPPIEAPDAEPEPEGCQRDEDCLAVLDLEACQPCPSAIERAQLGDDPCTVPFDAATPYYAYEPLACVEACLGLELSLCPEPPSGIFCDAGRCRLAP